MAYLEARGLTKVYRRGEETTVALTIPVITEESSLGRGESGNPE